MVTASSFTEETGLTVADICESPVFTRRRLRERDALRQMHGLQRLSRAFAEHPESMLHELVNTAVELCGADSAGISIETPEKGEASFYHWIAAAGDYSPFFDAVLPQYPSACSICLQRGQAQHFTVSKRFFDILGVEAPPVTDGLLLPWETADARGTIFVMAHTRTDVFDADDCRMMEMLADFASMAVTRQRNEQKLLQRAGVQGAHTLAHELAHRINNPLQSLTNLIYLASTENNCADVKRLAEELSPNLDRLTGVVRQLLEVRVEAARVEAAKEV